MPTWTIAAFTHRGRIRPHNEDTVAIGNRILDDDMDAPLVITAESACALLMIADGMGGHAQGAMASRAVLDYLVAAADRLSDPSSCAEVIEEANQQLFKIMSEHEEAIGMGTTLVGAALTPNRMVTFNLGDSRSYLFTGGQLVQLSTDDVPVGASDRFGARRSHALTQALGGSSFPIAVQAHISVDPPLAPGETLLLCSDGLTDMVTSEVIGSTLRVAPDPLHVARKLAAKTFSGGARDNFSLIVARHSDTPSGSQSS